MSGSIPRIVLDTNVCLDLFVFDDPRTARLRDAMRSGEIEAMTDAPCREEWRRVLAYPALALAETRQSAALAEFDRLTTSCDEGALATPADARRLPRCRDPDDQKFLELALRSGARWLLTRDDHLLALGRRTTREGWFAILTPQEWTAGQAP
ncbi:putative toxin-antitoxin system toxin component, PIN family [Lysobacter niabensis]|uniref:putative toxin-antitoxin system toxin component, PIN family n=1 Tax=Agrilutibacter niabensis TaxID=380628 RepID=UPI00361F7933